MKRRGNFSAGRNKPNTVLDKACRDIDKLAEFDQFCEEVLPALRRDLQSGMSAKSLREKYMAKCTAREISIAIGDPDSGKALTAIKNIVDRVEGKAVETKAITHKYEQMSDSQLDALLLTKLEDSKDAEKLN